MGKIMCKGTGSYDADRLKDTASVLLNFTSITNTKREYTVGSIPLKIKAGTTHLVTVDIIDLTSKKTEVTYLTADKTSPDCDQNFMLRNPANGYVVFSRSVDS